jgi:hypothetical protein
VELRLTDVDTRWQMQVYTELRRRRCERPRFDLRVFEEPIFEPDPIFERAPHTWGAWWRWVKRAVGYSWREATGTKRVVREGHHWQLQGVKLFEATFGFGPASVQPERVTLVRPEPDAAAAREEYRAVTADDPGGANSPPPAMPDAEMTVEQGRVGHEQVLAWLEGLPVSTREWAKLFPDDVLHDSLLPQVIAEASGRVPLSINSRENIAGIVRERRMALDDEERRGAAAGGGSGARARAGVWGRARAAAAASLLDVLDLDERSVSALRAWVEEFPWVARAPVRCVAVRALLPVVAAGDCRAADGCRWARRVRRWQVSGLCGGGSAGAGVRAADARGDGAAIGRGRRGGACGARGAAAEAGRAAGDPRR